MLVHDRDGIAGYERRRTEMLAGVGYAAFAVDLFGAGLRPDTVEGAQEASGALSSDRDAMRIRLWAGRDQLAELPAADPDNLVVAGVPQRRELYGSAPHAFTVFGSDSYREAADQQSWATFTDFPASRLR